MPFQVTLSVSVGKLPALSVSVPISDIYSPCAITVDLVAVFLSGNIQGHTFLWELGSGAQVLFTTPVNQLTASCSLLGITTDRVFYFWVDKNRPTQQLFTINFWGTITETRSIYGSNQLINSGLNIDNSSPNCASIQGIIPLEINPITATTNPTTFALVWSLPTNLIGLQSLRVEESINGIWVQIANLLPTDSQITSPVSNNAYYRIRTIYLLNNQYYDQYSCTYYLLLNIANYNIYHNDSILLASNVFTLNTLLNFTLLSTDSVTNELIEPNPLNNTNIFFITSLLNFTLLSTDNITNELIETNPLNNTNLFLITSVVYLGGTAIGG